jgi:hypothetical protein
MPALRSGQLYVTRTDGTDEALTAPHVPHFSTAANTVCEGITTVLPKY